MTFVFTVLDVDHRWPVHFLSLAPGRRNESRYSIFFFQIKHVGFVIFGAGYKSRLVPCKITHSMYYEMMGIEN